MTRLSNQITFEERSFWLLDFTSFKQRAYKVLLLLFHRGSDKFCIQGGKFLQPNGKKVNVIIDGDPHQLLQGSILPRNMYQEIGKRFLRENSDVSFEEYLTTKYELWIDTRSSTDNKLHSSGRLMNSGVKLQIDKVVESSGNLTCYIFAVQDAYAHLSDGKLDAIDL